MLEREIGEMTQKVGTIKSYLVEFPPAQRACPCPLALRTGRCMFRRKRLEPFSKACFMEPMS